MKIETQKNQISKLKTFLKNLIFKSNYSLKFKLLNNNSNKKLILWLKNSIS
jgi:hypothetical protein